MHPTENLTEFWALTWACRARWKAVSNEICSMTSFSISGYIEYHRIKLSSKSFECKTDFQCQVSLQRKMLVAVFIIIVHIVRKFVSFTLNNENVMSTMAWRTQICKCCQVFFFVFPFMINGSGRMCRDGHPWDPKWQLGRIYKSIISLSIFTRSSIHLPLTIVEKMHWTCTDRFLHWNTKWWKWLSSV